MEDETPTCYAPNLNGGIWRVKTACGQVVAEASQIAFIWEDVTCPNCLKAKQ